MRPLHTSVGDLSYGLVNKTGTPCTLDRKKIGSKNSRAKLCTFFHDRMHILCNPTMRLPRTGKKVPLISLALSRHLTPRQTWAGLDSANSMQPCDSLAESFKGMVLRFQ